MRAITSPDHEPRSPDALSETKHREIHAFSCSLLKKIELVKPEPGKPGSDRSVRALLPGKDALKANGVAEEYRVWIERTIDNHGAYLSPRDNNLLRSNLIEISTYIRMERRGQDVSVEMYRDLFTQELLELLFQQDDVFVMIRERSTLPYMAAKRRYWHSVPLTIGVEEEYQIVSRKNWALSPKADEVLRRADDAKHFSREVYQSQVEMKTDPLGDIPALANDLRRLREQLQSALPKNLAVVSAATHPFSTWNAQQPHHTPRTDLFVHDMQDAVRRLVTFGLHVHIGVDDPELRIQIMNSARQIIPLLLAVSSSSPYWEGRDTGFQSYRSSVFAVLPRTGIPPVFPNNHAFERYVNLLATTRSFDSKGSNDPTKIWWDVRLHPKYPTIEFRICDACSRIVDTVCIAALCQAVVAKLARLLHDGQTLRIQWKPIIEENKWRAARYGRRARFIDERTEREVTCRYAALELLDFVDDVLDDLGSRSEAHHILTILDKGTSSNRQTVEYRRNESLTDVVRLLAKEFTE
ncbi:MAG TPA: carboxylate-amine ligase [Gemmatimonadaceae bacterium]|nr:carboxylate-amine ligase [Gemmatimonadaceae bacterium]